MKLESQIEVSTGAKLLKWALARSLRLLYLKFTSPGRTGVPDRMVLVDGKVIFIEFKRPGEVPTKLQAYMHEQLREMGFVVLVKNTNDIEDIVCLIE